MKSYFIAALTICAVTLVSAQKCVEQEECAEGMCCSGIPPFGGICRNLTAAGGKCHLKDRTAPIFGDFVIGPCPCAEGLVCVQFGKNKNDGICQLPATTTAAPMPEEPVEDPEEPVEEPVEEPEEPVEEPVEEPEEPAVPEEKSSEESAAEE